MNGRKSLALKRRARKESRTGKYVISERYKQLKEESKLHWQKPKSKKSKRQLRFIAAGKERRFPAQLKEMKVIAKKALLGIKNTNQ